MNKTKLVTLVAVLGLTSPVLSACNWDNPPRNETCTITARGNDKVTTKCVDQHGEDTGGGGTYDVPDDLYPNCVVGTFWEACKQAVS